MVNLEIDIKKIERGYDLERCIYKYVVENDITSFKELKHPEQNEIGYKCKFTCPGYELDCPCYTRYGDIIR